MSDCRGDCEQCSVAWRDAGDSDGLRCHARTGNAFVNISSTNCAFVFLQRMEGKDSEFQYNAQSLAVNNFPLPFSSYSPYPSRFPEDFGLERAESAGV